ncbi:MAG: hypothetical protein HOO06_07905 [Bdellovibrionaceae bacterium]|jgi:hypothetical protein|nr:hypothetical protein [Pseudobdellovibrionaceae bacterium]
MVKNFYIFILLCVFFLHNYSWAQTQSERINSLEEEMASLRDEITESKFIKSTNSKKMNLGGYLTMQASGISGQNSPASVRKIELETIISGEMFENLKYFSEVEVELESSLGDTKHTGDRLYGVGEDIVKLERLWLSYQTNQYIGVRSGLFFTPMGIANRLHYQPVILTSDRPLFLRNGLFVRRFTGVSIVGKLNDYLNYELYGGSDIDVIQTPFVGGFYLGFDLSNIVPMRVGLSNQNSQSISDGSLNVYGIDTNVEWNNFLFKAEYFVDDLNGEGYYIQPSFKTKRWRFFFRQEFADTNKLIDKDDDHKRQSFGLNYLFAGDKRIKIDHQKYTYTKKQDVNNKDKDYSKLVLELSLTF